MQVKKEQLEPDMNNNNWLQIGKGVCQGSILSPCLFNLYAEYIMGNSRLDEAPAAIKIVVRNVNNLRNAYNTTLMAQSEEELKSLLMKVKEESKKAGFKLSIKTTKTVTSSSITYWQIEREKVETLTDFIFFGSKITADSDWSYEIKRRLLLRRKAMTNLESILKSRDINLSTKVPKVKAMVLTVVIYRGESWTIKKVDHWRIDAFKLWC